MVSKLEELQLENEELKKEIQTLKTLLYNNKTNKLVNLIDNVEKLLSSEFQSKDGETKIKGDEAITTRLFSIIANGDDKTSLFAINLLKELLKLKYQQDTNLF